LIDVYNVHVLYSADLLEMIRMDAMSMDLLRGSPRIVNIYSHCGGSVQVEAIGGPSITELVEHEKRSRMDDPPPMLSPTEKLNMAVEMAEGLADLHGFEGGPIVHNDVQIGQYLIDENYHARMSDFNRADPLLFDNTKGEYCKVILGDASGELRSPEEYKTDPTDEKIDVYSFGNVIQTLLTGHYPYDDYNDDSIEAWRLSVDGITPHVGSNIRGNSFAESALASVMDKCFEYHAEKRIDIFTVVDLLKEAAELNDRFESIEVGSHEEDEWDPETYYDEDGWKKWLPW
jgi:serine/threonine protein kinase